MSCGASSSAINRSQGSSNGVVTGLTAKLDVSPSLLARRVADQRGQRVTIERHAEPNVRMARAGFDDAAGGRDLERGDEIIVRVVAHAPIADSDFLSALQHQAETRLEHTNGALRGLAGEGDTDARDRSLNRALAGVARGLCAEPLDVLLHGLKIRPDRPFDKACEVELERIRQEFEVIGRAADRSGFQTIAIHQEKSDDQTIRRSFNHGRSARGSRSRGQAPAGDRRLGRPRRRDGAGCSRRNGASVVGTVRDLDKGRRATAGIPGIELIELDLASLKSVRATADKLNAKADKFDLVIANAGVMAIPTKTFTPDGFETQFGTNHLGTLRARQSHRVAVQAGRRLVNLSSAGHRYSDVNLGRPQFRAY